jgi:hypothetical protein
MNTTNIDVKWFKDRIRDLGTSQRQISLAVSPNHNALSLVLAGKRRVTHAEIPALANLLEVTPDELLKRLGVEAPATPKSHTVPCRGSVDETGKLDPDRQQIREVTAPANVTANTRGVLFRSLGGANMQQGWVYYFDEAAKPRAVDAESLNALCFVEIGDREGYYLGVIQRGLERGRYDIVNPFTRDLLVGGVSVRSASPITWIKTA